MLTSYMPRSCIKRSYVSAYIGEIHVPKIGSGLVVADYWGFPTAVKR